MQQQQQHRGSCAWRKAAAAGERASGEHSNSEQSVVVSSSERLIICESKMSPNGATEKGNSIRTATTTTTVNCQQDTIPRAGSGCNDVRGESYSAEPILRRLLLRDNNQEATDDKSNYKRTRQKCCDSDGSSEKKLRTNSKTTTTTNRWLLVAALTFAIVVCAVTQQPAVARTIRRTGDNNTGNERLRYARQVAAPNNRQQRQPQQAASPDALKVAALASKLEHWLMCQRMNAALLQVAVSGSGDDGHLAAAATEAPPPTTAPLPEAVAATAAAAATAEAEKQGASVPARFSKPGAAEVLPEQRKSAAAHITSQQHCRPYFDGHLCWPATKAGDRAQVQCPRLKWLPMANAIMQQQAAAASTDANLADGSTPATLLPTTSPIVIKVGADQTTRAGSSTRSINLAQPQQQQQTNDEARRQLNNGALDPVMNDIVNLNSEPDQDEDVLSAQMALRPAPMAVRYCRADAINSFAAGSGGGDNLLSSSAAPGQSAARSPGKGTARWDSAADYGACYGAATNAYDHPESPRPASFDPTDQWVKLNQTDDRRLFDQLGTQLERIEANIDPYGDQNLLDQWILCIGNIMRADSSAQQQTGDTADTCPIIFDGWRCWPSTRAGDTAYVSCPSHHPGFIAERKAHKICTLEGDWYKHPQTERYWSNYTTCVDTVDLAFRTKIISLYVFGNLISLVALAASLIIFISFKSLDCTRVTIHKNLFLSFITNNLMWIIWYTYVVNDADLLQSNPIECQFWHILLHYFLVSNYFWMFCEGLYLHTLLVVAFVSEDKILKWFYLLGWLTPVPITMAYAYNRAQDEYYTNFCWMEESPHNVILMAPIGISLLLNLIFLINIVRVLVTKLRANNSPDAHQTRKAVRATLILIPLLGLHYILTPFRPEPKSEYEVIYEITAAICTSFQGLCVAMLFCFCNGEVIAAIKKKLKDTCILKRRRRARSGTGFEGSLLRSRSNTNSNCETTVMTHHLNNFSSMNISNSHNFNISSHSINHDFNVTNNIGNQQHSTGNNHTLQSVISSSSIRDNNQINSQIDTNKNANNINPNSPLQTTLANM